jgi:hypothetical protein
MALESVKFVSVRYKGCPEGYRNISFVHPDGTEIGALVQAEEGWTLTLLRDPDVYRYFVVASSPDGESLHFERWLGGHMPFKLRFGSQAEQLAALGIHAGNSDPQQLLDAAIAQLTKDDAPTPVPARKLELVSLPAEVRKTSFGQRTGYMFGEYIGKICVWLYGIGPAGRMAVTTKGSKDKLVDVFRHQDSREAYLLFDAGTDYLVETLEWWGSRYRRREATAAKSGFAGMSNADIVKAMAPSLAESQ